MQTPSAHPSRYALVYRPAGIGTVPPSLAFSVAPRPPAGQPHHEMARHGILQPERRLTNAEILAFELAPLVDGEEELAALAGKVAEEMRRYAANYVEAHAEDKAFVDDHVLRQVSTVMGYRVSLADPDALIDLVIARLREITDHPSLAD